MKADTWMPLYIADYLKDTMHLSTELHGAYFLLLMACWGRGGFLPADDAQLSGIARMPLPAWRRARPIIAAFFDVDDGQWSHGRVKIEWDKAQQLSASRRENGAKGGRPRKQDESAEKPIGLLEPSLTETPALVARPSPLPSEVTTDAVASVTHARVLAGEFETWWKGYPHKVGKGQARTAFERARRKGVSLAELVAGIDRYRVSKPADYAWRNPATWLNGEGWADEPATVIQLRQPATAAPSLTDRIAADHAEARRRVLES